MFAICHNFFMCETGANGQHKRWIFFNKKEKQVLVKKLFWQIMKMKEWKKKSGRKQNNLGFYIEENARKSYLAQQNQKEWLEYCVR